MLISIWGAAFEEEEMSLGEPRSATIWNAHLAHLFRNATVLNATEFWDMWIGALGI